MAKARERDLATIAAKAGISPETAEKRPLVQRGTKEKPMLREKEKAKEKDTHHTGRHMAAKAVGAINGLECVRLE